MSTDTMDLDTARAVIAAHEEQERAKRFEERAQYVAEYAKLSDAKLATKIRKLYRAMGRMTLQRNVEWIASLIEVAVAEAEKRTKRLQETRPREPRG